MPVEPGQLKPTATAGLRQRPRRRADNTLRGVPGMSVVAARMSVVTEPSAPSSRHAPKRPPAAIEDLDLLVKVTGRPDAIRAYTAAEQAEAEAYAAAVGGVIEPLLTNVS